MHKYRRVKKRASIQRVDTIGDLSDIVPHVKRWTESASSCERHVMCKTWNGFCMASNVHAADKMELYQIEEATKNTDIVILSGSRGTSAIATVSRDGLLYGLPQYCNNSTVTSHIPGNRRRENRHVCFGQISIQHEESGQVHYRSGGFVLGKRIRRSDHEGIFSNAHLPEKQLL